MDYYQAGVSDSEKFTTEPEVGDLLFSALESCTYFFYHQNGVFPCDKDIVASVDEYIRGYVDTVRERTLHMLPVFNIQKVKQWHREEWEVN